MSLERLPQFAAGLKRFRWLIWCAGALGLAVGVAGRVLAYRRAEGAVLLTYAGFILAATTGALHSIGFWFAPGSDGVRSRFDRLHRLARPYPFLEVFLALMWLAALLMSACGAGDQDR